MICTRCGIDRDEGGRCHCDDEFADLVELVDNALAVLGNARERSSWAVMRATAEDLVTSLNEVLDLLERARKGG